LAAVLAAEGNRDNAMFALEASVKAGMKDRARLMSLPEFEPLKTTLRFQLLMKAFGG